MDAVAGDGRATGSGAEAAAEAQAFVRHELRTPLAVIEPLVGMLRDGTAGPLNEKQLGYVGMLERNVARLSAMIASVVESGWLEIAAVPPEPRSIIVGELVRDTVAGLRASLETTPPLQVHLEDGLPWLQGDAYRLGRALHNVVLNACTFTPDDGLVSVHVARGPSEDSVSIAVVDSGCGVGADDLPHVFDFGFRGGAARAGGRHGLGLGLPVARAIIESHGGSITIEGAPDGGTRVSIDLPTASA